MKREGNLRYVIKTVGAADKGLVWFTLIKNSMEQIFYVFFFVYLTKYIFECIEKNIAYPKLFWFLVVACSLHIVIHFMCGWYECYRQINTPKIYRYIFHQVMDISDCITLSEYEDPKFYDSYTKALEQCVDQAKDATVIFISHRLSTTRMADRIYLFAEGGIKEQGTHDELMALGGEYKEMFDRQAKNYIMEV